MRKWGTPWNWDPLMVKTVLVGTQYFMTLVKYFTVWSFIFSEAYVCSDGELIPHRWLCDTFVDCQDGADESNCGKVVE